MTTVGIGALKENSTALYNVSSSDVNVSKPTMLQKVGGIALKALRGLSVVLNKLFCDPATLMYSTGLFINGHSLYQYARGTSGGLSKLAAKLVSVGTVIDAVSVIGQLNYFANTKKETDSVFQKCKNAFMLSAGIGTIALLIAENVKKVSSVALKVLEKSVLSFAALGYAFKGVFSAVQIHDASKKIRAEAEEIAHFSGPIFGKINNDKSRNNTIQDLQTYYQKRAAVAKAKKSKLEEKPEVCKGELKRLDTKIELFEEYLNELKANDSSYEILKTSFHEIQLDYYKTKTEEATGKICKLNEKEKLKKKQRRKLDLLADKINLWEKYSKALKANNGSYSKLKVRFHEIKLDNAATTRKKSILGLVQSVAEVAFKVLLIIGCLNVVGIAVLATATAALGIATCVLYTKQYDAAKVVLKEKVEG